MYVLKEKMMNFTGKLRMFGANKLAKKDAGESHVITVIAMCVIGIALVLILLGFLEPMIETLCQNMQTNILSMFEGL